MNNLKVVVIIIMVIINIIFLPSKGTGDVLNWQRLTDKIVSSKTDRIFPDCLNYQCGVFYPRTYPPGHFLIIFLFAKILPVSDLGSLLTVKLSILIFYFLNLAAVIFFVFKYPSFKNKVKILDTVLIYLLLFSLGLNTQGLGYTDIFVMPFLTLCLLFLILKKSFIVGFLFSVSFLIKWQPLILFPFIAVYIFITNQKPFKSMAIFIAGLLVPVTMLLPLNPGIFPVLFDSLLNGALTNPFMSAALNFQYIIAFIFYRFFDNVVLPVSDRLLPYVFIPEERFTVLIIWPKIFFLLVYFLIIIFFIRKMSKKDFSSGLFFKISSLIYFLYFFISSGVHENHLVLAVFFYFLYYLINPDLKKLFVLFILDFINFINLFIFYGVTGIPLFSQNNIILLSIIFAFIFSIILFPVIIFTYFSKDPLFGRDKQRMNRKEVS